jgi:hypothetical protein
MVASLSFDTLNQAWNTARMNNAAEFRQMAPTLTDPSRLLLSRVTETPYLLTVMFRGFDQALTDTDRGVPMAKRMLLTWVKRFAPAQIERGDEDSLIIRITKPPQNPMPQPALESIIPDRTGPLVHISHVRKIDGD